MLASEYCCGMKAYEFGESCHWILLYVGIFHCIWCRQWSVIIFYFYCGINSSLQLSHDDVIKWKHFPRNWPFVRGIHRSPVNSPHKGQWGGALMFSLIYAWINDWENNREASDLSRYHGHNDVNVMTQGVITGSKEDISFFRKSPDRPYLLASNLFQQRSCKSTPIVIDGPAMVIASSRT